MAKHSATNTKKTNQATRQPVAPKQMVIDKSGPKKTQWILAAIIAVFGMLLYANTYHHTFVLDDYSVIAENKITKGGVDSLGSIFKSGYREGNYTVSDALYRPFTKAMFAIEYDKMGGEEYFADPDHTPTLMHAINIILYGFLCAFIFLSFLKFFPDHFYAVLIASLLFTFHPIHTEVVANIKSRDEILNLFFIIASLRFAFQYGKSSNALNIIGIAGFYFLALLTKESAITYVALLPVTMYFFRSKPVTIVISVVAAVVITGIYLQIHHNVIGTIGLKQSTIPVADNSLMQEGSTTFTRMLTAIYILGLYLLLLIFPHPLSSDYSFNTIEMVKTFGHPGLLLSLVVHIALVVLAIRGLKKRALYSYAILFYIITISIVSNLIPGALIGTNMAERLIFGPSLGFCILVGVGLETLFKLVKQVPASISNLFSKPWVFVLLVPVLVAFAVKTHNRNKDWKNVSTLFNKDIKTVPNSVHMLLYHAGMITNSDSLAIKTPQQKINTLQLAEKELVKAKNMLATFPNVYGSLARVYKETGEFYMQNQNPKAANDYYIKAIDEYRINIRYTSTDPTSYNNLATCFFAIGRYDSAEVYFTQAMKSSPICYDDAMANLGSVYGMYGVASQNAGRKEEAVMNFNRSIDMFNKALECNPNNIQSYQFLGVTYNNLGDTAKARPYLVKFQEMQQQKMQRLEKMKK